MTGSAQERYLDPQFGVKLTKDIVFGENKKDWNDPESVQTLRMDIYEPDGDDAEARPLIVLAFGGGFVYGLKESPDIVDLCNRFTELGYVCASIEYRLSLELATDPSIPVAFQAVAKGYHDMKAAVRFFRKDADTENQYRIDPELIFAGGVSAGAVAAVHMAYLDELEEVPEELNPFIESEGGLEGNSGNPGYSSEVAGILNLCGAIADTSWITEGDIPIVSVHGSADSTVPYGSAPLGLFGLDLPLHGSSSIHDYVADKNMDHAFLPFPGAGHTPFILNSPSVAQVYMDSTFQITRDFVYELVRRQITGLEDHPLTSNLTAQSLITLFPNPITEHFSIRPNDTNILVETVAIYSATGQLMSRQTSDFNFDVQAFPEGLYLVKIQTNQGEVMEKILVQ